MKAELAAFMKSYPEAKPPGLRVWVQQGGRTVSDLSWGQVWPLYDLASLTKIFFTTNAFMRAVQEHGLRLSRNLSDFLPVPEGLQIQHLLSHTSGLKGWAPFYQRVDLKAPVPWRWQMVKREVFQQVPRRPESSPYSDINFVMLGWVLEEFYSEPLLRIFQTLTAEGWLPEGIHFNPLGQPLRHPPHHYAPTERCPWRKKLLQGEVHDDNTWALGGVAPHAGLFGSMDDVKKTARMWRDTLFHKSVPGPLRKSTLQKFIRQAGAGDFGLGFMLPTPGKSSAGKYFSKKSFGHTGFTGTSLWVDAQRDQVVAVLSNRVYPQRQLVDFKTFRPRLHNFLLEKRSLA